MGANAMEMFRHIREEHLTEIKKLKIKIGDKPTEEGKRKGVRPGPRSKTKKNQHLFPFMNLLNTGPKEEDVKIELPDIKKEEPMEEPMKAPLEEPLEEPMEEETFESLAQEASQNDSNSSDRTEQMGVLKKNEEIKLTLKTSGFRLRLSTEDDALENQTEEELADKEPAEEEPAEEEPPIEVDPNKDWHDDQDEIDLDNPPANTSNEINSSNPSVYDFDDSFD